MYTFQMWYFYSIVMTTCSSIASLVLMPLLLYIFSQGFPGLKNAVPYVGIITALLFTLVPCVIGIFINHYKPNYSSTITKVSNETKHSFPKINKKIFFFNHLKLLCWKILSFECLSVHIKNPVLTAKDIQQILLAATEVLVCKRILNAEVLHSCTAGCTPQVTQNHKKSQL